MAASLGGGRSAGKHRKRCLPGETADVMLFELGYQYSRLLVDTSCIISLLRGRGIDDIISKIHFTFRQETALPRSVEFGDHWLN